MHGNKRLAFIWRALRFEINRQLLGTTLALLLASYVMAVVNTFSDRRARALLPRDAPPLPDVAFELLPAVAPSAQTAVVNVSIACQALLAFVALALQCRHRRTSYLVVYMRSHIAVLVLRCATLFGTVMPPPTPCRDDGALASTYDSVLFEAAVRFTRGDPFFAWCHDTMFSGHAAFLALVAVFVALLPTHVWLVSMLSASTAVAGALMLLAARLHYVSDVVVALIAVALVASNYTRRAIAKIEFLSPYHANRLPSDAELDSELASSDVGETCDTSADSLALAIGHDAEMRK